MRKFRKKTKAAVIFYQSILEWTRYKINQYRSHHTLSGNIQGHSTKLIGTDRMDVYLKFLSEGVLVALVVFSVYQTNFKDNQTLSIINKYTQNYPNINTSLHSKLEEVSTEIDATSSSQDQSNSLRPNEESRLLYAASNETTLIDEEQNALSPRSPDDIQKSILSRIQDHIVAEGETIESIAAKYKVKPQTIIWTNQLEGKKLQTGQTVKVLPVDGILVRFGSNSTLRDIASKYRGDLNDILSYNGFLDESEPEENQLIICPKCTIPPERPKPTIKPERTKPSIPAEYQNLAVLDDDLFDGTGTSHSFEPGNCTWFVAKHFPVKFGGHARYWLTNAKRAGYETGSTPEIGSAVVMGGNTRYGHVALVVDVDGDKVKLREMNYRRLYQVTERWIDKDTASVYGYIYRP